jgi:hypothetical protein
MSRTKPVIYVGTPPALPLPVFVWGVLVGAASVALAFLAVLVWPVTP